MRAPKRRENNVLRAELRASSALERQAAYNTLTVQQKLERLDKQFGPGLGAKKQRAKLAKLLNKEPAKVAAPVAQAEPQQPKVKRSKSEAKGSKQKFKKQQE
jgi:hypothetical protein